MKQYTEKFSAHEIDVDLLPSLTEQHLQQMGVTTVGARLRIMNAVKGMPQSHSLFPLLSAAESGVLLPIIPSFDECCLFLPLSRSDLLSLFLQLCCLKKRTKAARWTVSANLPPL